MAKEMLVNAVEQEECRVAIVEDGQLQEYYVERASAVGHVGNIYKGRVANVEASIQAAFVDCGFDTKGCFLHVSDLHPKYFHPTAKEVTEPIGKKVPHHERPLIQQALRRGQDVLVQVIKEGIGGKGATVTTYLSLPGRYLVLMPGMTRMGISRKIEESDDREKLRKVLGELNPPKNMGFIIRTAGSSCTKRDLQRDMAYLLRMWRQIADKAKRLTAPAELYRESDLVVRTIRDVYDQKIESVVVDSQPVADRAKEFLRIMMTRGQHRVRLYDGHEPIFYKHRIEHQVEELQSRRVNLPSGGYLIIDQAEALVAIDVNTGRARERGEAERTAYVTNLEAASEVPRQLRLRDLGGVIVVDFIDMYDANKCREVERTLRDGLKKDRAKSKVSRMSQFGLMEMTRQRQRTSLTRSSYMDCPHCRGSGWVKMPESMALQCIRRIRSLLCKEGLRRLEVSTSHSVCSYLQNQKRKVILELEERTGRRVLIHADENLSSDETRFQGYDDRDRPIESLGPA